MSASATHGDHNKHKSSVTDERALRAASRQTCCKQRWTLNLSKVANFNISHLHLAPPLRVTRLSFAEIFGIRKLESLGYRVALFAFSLTIGRSSTGTAVKIGDFRITRHNSRTLTVASIVNLVVSVEHRLVTDRQTDTRLRHIPR